MVGTTNDFKDFQEKNKSQRKGNKHKPLIEQRLRVDFIRPEKWWHRAKWSLVYSLYFQEIKVPKGFVTDMGTIPRFLWFLFDPVNQYAKATIIHDYALSIKEREEADRIFKEALLMLDIPKWRVQTMYFSVVSYRNAKQVINSFRKHYK